MQLKSYLEILYNYTYWANKRYLAVAETLAETPGKEKVAQDYFNSLSYS
jgi:hypothetical protein